MGKSIFLLVFDLRIANFSSTSRQRLVEVPALGAWRISVSPWGVELERSGVRYSSDEESGEDV